MIPKKIFLLDFNKNVNFSIFIINQLLLMIKSKISVLLAGKSVARELLIAETVLNMREGHSNPEFLISLVENMKNQ